MSVSETLKTRIGIKKFILPTGSEENAVLAFEYTDKKTEVHLLKVNETKYRLGHRLYRSFHTREVTKEHLISFSSCDFKTRLFSRLLRHLF